LWEDIIYLYGVCLPVGWMYVGVIVYMCVVD
jgi:hypothetical protein